MSRRLALFVLPSGAKAGLRLLDWDHAVQLPWGVLLIFGGGLSLAAGVDPLLLLSATAISASCAFMMPVATPPQRHCVRFGSPEHPPEGACRAAA